MTTNFSDSILQKDVSRSVTAFLSEILMRANKLKLDNETVLIPVVSKRCMSLLSEFYAQLCAYLNNSNHKECQDVMSEYSRDDIFVLKETFESCIVTCDNVLNMTYDIVSEYRRTGKFPTIFVVDDILIHGREINEFLYEIEKCLNNAEAMYDKIKKTVYVEYKSSIQAFLKHLHIFVINYNTNTSVLLPRYKTILDSDNQCFTLQNNQLKKCLITHSQYTSVCGINNIDFPVAFLTSEHDVLDSLSNVDGEFIKISTELQGIPQDSYIFHRSL